MPRNVLITGSAISLGSHLAALRLTSSDDALCYLAQSGRALSAEGFAQLVRDAVRRIAPERDADDAKKLVGARLRRLGGESSYEVPDALGARADEVWFLSGGPCHARRRGARTDAAALCAILSALPQLRATEFNYVSPAHADDADECISHASESKHEAGDNFAASQCAAERDVRERCDALGIGCRIFRTSLLAGESPLPPGARGEGLLNFLSALHAIKSEMEERTPEYFEYHALRCLAPDGATLNLLRVEQAADWMLRIARGGGTLGHRYDLVGPADVQFTDLCERMGAAYDLSLLAVAGRDELNAVDRLFHERLDSFQAFFTSPGERAPDDDDAGRAADFAPRLAPLDEDAQTALFQAVRRRQDAARAARAGRIAALPAALERKTVERDDSGLTYYASGSGSPPVVLLNALGQGLHYWYRLMDELMRRRRVFIWEPRGLESASRPFRLGDHVDDLEAILAEEAVETCHLIGWCTGPKVALEFYHRRPEAVASMVFLNSSFKSPDSPEELDTDYERNLEPLCRLLDRRPEVAASVRTTLLSRAVDGARDALDETDSERVAAGVLSMMNVELRQHVLAPFRSESALINYSRQLIDFWSHDARAGADAVRAPVLMISSEYDKIASPEMSHATSRQLPTARHVRVRGATHYCLYDRPELIAELIEVFFENPDGLDDVDGEAEAIRPRRDASPEAGGDPPPRRSFS
jgi:pimeloyl-ACP methyl ester carboxylesterase/nucleoside-diphosphate-sugar epimerase